MLAEQRLQQRDFSALGGFEKLLLDCRQRVDGIGLNGQRMVLYPPADRRDRFRPGGGEQQRLTFGRGKADHLIDGLAEAHIQHPIGFIHHQRLQRIQRHGALLQVI